MIDPAGFALENFDAIGRFRVVDESWNVIDASGALPDGTQISGRGRIARGAGAAAGAVRNYGGGEVADVRAGPGPGILRYASGAKNRRDAAPDYKLQSMIVGVAKSYPFLMRKTVTQ